MWTSAANIRLQVAIFWARMKFPGSLLALKANLKSGRRVTGTGTASQVRIDGDASSGRFQKFFQHLILSSLAWVDTAITLSGNTVNIIASDLTYVSGSEMLMFRYQLMAMTGLNMKSISPSILQNKQSSFGIQSSLFQKDV